MKISVLLDNINNIVAKKGQKDPEITNIVFDSREVTCGSLFFALKGIHTDGHKYIEKTIEMGAGAICHSDDLDYYDPDVVYIQVKCTRESLSQFSAAFFSYPSRELKVVGVTGTDGKSTTVSLIHQLLELTGHKAGYISTISYKSDDKEIKNPWRQSTPEACQIQSLLREMRNNGKEYAVVESTSHGLSKKTNRLGDVEFNTGVITNITSEHLEFHGTLEQYRNDKANLFRALKSPSTGAIINNDDDSKELLIEASPQSEHILYSMKDTSAALYASDCRPDSRGTTFFLNGKGFKEEVRLNLPGLFNVENAMAAVLAVSHVTGLKITDITPHITSLSSVEGRMNSIDFNGNFSVVVDYAHSPGSFRFLLPECRKRTQGRLITVFGSAGERCVEKRSEQGEIADEYADIIILTDEDPRLEDPMTIINNIKEGISGKTEEETLFTIPDRRSAIKKAIDLAQEGDMILCLGKGHEGNMFYPEGPRDWNEKGVVKEILREKELL